MVMLINLLVPTWPCLFTVDISTPRCAWCFITETCPYNIQNFFGCKNSNFHQIFFFAQNIDCGYTLEPHRRAGSNEYPQSMFWIKNKKNRVLYKSGV